MLSEGMDLDPKERFWHIRRWYAMDKGRTTLRELLDAIVAATLAADLDTYQAKVVWFDDESNVTDRYVVTWFKNSQPITSGITVPKLQIVKVADGTNLIAASGMTEIASLGRYRYDATTTERQTSGVAYLAIATATIGGSTQTWDQPVSRDSTA